MIGLLIIVLVSADVVPTSAHLIDTSSSAARGWSIANERHRRNQGFGDSIVDIAMVLINSSGRERTRRMRVRTFDHTDPNKGDRSLTTFLGPPNIEGTAFLTHTNIDKVDSQWMYLPALNRVRRISASNMTQSFMGSEFTYEDLLSDEVSRYDYQWLRDEGCGDLTCAVIDRRPKYSESAYSSQRVWIDLSEYRLMKVDYFGKDGSHIKTLQLLNYRAYLGLFWRAHRAEMNNHQTSKATTLDFSTFEFNTGLTERDFEPRVLTRR